MASEPRIFDTNLYYHVYNCGVEKRKTFLNTKDYQRFLDICAFYAYDQQVPFSEFQKLAPEAKNFYLQKNPRERQKLRIKILSYCPMPNHFHFLVKPVRENGISVFLSDIQNSYTKYFNIKNTRVGSLFQGVYKLKEISDEESVLQVSRYIHLNPVISSKANPDSAIKRPEDYPYTSYREWTGLANFNLVDEEELSEWLKIAGGIESYKEFVESMIGKVNPALGVENLIMDEQNF